MKASPLGFGLFFYLGAAAALLPSAAANFQCPPSPSDPPTTLASAAGADAVVLGRPSGTGTLCTLSVVRGDGTGRLQPVARTYDGRQWEASAGPYASDIPFRSSLDICGDDVSDCSVVLPVLSEPRTFRLTTHDVNSPSLSDRDVAARFLESATFGPTPDDLDSVTAGGNDFEGWIEGQMNDADMMTSHRAYFRRRMNPMWTGANRFARAIHPCESDSRWRRIAFTEKDNNSMLTVEGSGPYLLSIDGHPRTVVPNLVMKDTYYGVLTPGSYKICYKLEHWVGGIMFLEMPDGSCKVLLDGNPALNFDETNFPGRVPTTVVNLPPMDTAAVRSGQSIYTFMDVARTAELEFMHHGPLTDASCSTPTLYDVGVGDPFYALITIDGISEWAAYDPRLHLDANTISNPLDNGRDLVNTYSPHFDASLPCANAPRTFLNEAGCTLQSGPNVCGRGVDGIVGIGQTNALVCGSPNEVGNDVRLGDDGYDAHTSAGGESGIDTTFDAELEQQKSQVFTNIALTAPDRLRQRAAFALSQILVLVPDAIQTKIRNAEDFINFHDIFVRNAFGNYRDVLREISYNPLMAENLSFLESKSAAYVLERNQIRTFADENYAREIMQLFTVGMVNLNMDGTEKIDPTSGSSSLAYTNEHIMSMARAWTGFLRQDYKRSNVMDYAGNGNRVDPMDVRPDWRDRFPKIDLGGGYVGDGYPLCTDAPSGQFLNKGATYRLLGGQRVPDMHEENPDYANGQMRLEVSGGALFNALDCQDDGNGGGCTYATTVVLQSDLSCMGSTSTADLCDLDDVRVVNVGPDVHYEYVAPPCVRLPFLSSGTGRQICRNVRAQCMCADPGAAVAREACCSSASTSKAFLNCAFLGERMSYAKAQERCAVGTGKTVFVNNKNSPTFAGFDTCDWKYIPNFPTNNQCAEYKHSHYDFYWTSAGCSTQAKISSDGMVALVHDPESNPTYGTGVVDELVDGESSNYFPVRWEGAGAVPDADSGCGASCAATVDGACLCDAIVAEDEVFASAPAGAAEVLAQLKIGSRDVTADSSYSAHSTIGDVIVHIKNSGAPYDTDTVFEVTEPKSKKTVFLKNVESTVSIAGVLDLSFRNPPHFMNLADADKRDALYETEAVLDHLFYHPNTAPFLALRFIQRFGTSNPSPAYIEAVATAFYHGTYARPSGTTTFGSGNYGDLAATFAAVLLHPEARSLSLDADPAHGSLREPLLKVLALLRSMSFGADADYAQLRLESLSAVIGQQSYEYPTVFSFFLPEFTPLTGPVAGADLVSPEATVLTGPRAVGLMNGLFSLIKYGLSPCDYGFGHSVRERWPWRCGAMTLEGDYDRSVGRLYYEADMTDVKGTVGELATLLTSGRLSDESRLLIETAVQDRYDEVSLAARHRSLQDSSSDAATAALRLAQELIVAAPEFHATNRVHRDATSTRPAAAETSSAGDTSDYKAIVYVMLAGGVDSFNMLAPMPHECTGVGQDGVTPVDMYGEYAKIRSDIALGTSDLRRLPVDARSGSQPCTALGLHKNLPLLEELYGKNEALFVANAGALDVAGLTKDTYQTLTGLGLFAHNEMQLEAQRVDPLEDDPGTGVIGRIMDTFAATGRYSTGSTSLDDPSAALGGHADGASPPTSIINSKTGPAQFDPSPSTSTVRTLVEELNGATDSGSSGFFAETWSSILHPSLDRSDELAAVVNAATLAQTFPDTILGRQLEYVAKLIDQRAVRGVQRDAFHVSMGGWDVHGAVLEPMELAFADVNDALSTFVAELEGMSVWDDVVVVQTSDFGRTLTPNGGGGSDHAWGGNYFLLGGGIDGGKVLGEYPDIARMCEGCTGYPIHILRGRLVPTTPWDSIWNGIAEWFGVEEGELDAVLPNRAKFATHFTQCDLFGQACSGSRRFLRDQQ